MTQATSERMFDFMMAAWGGEITQLESFIKRNPAVIHWRDNEGRTALIKSIAHGTGHVDAMAMLLEKGSDINARDKGGMTPLMFAALHNKPDCLALLLEKGADDTRKDGRGMTAVDHALKLGHTNIVTALRHAQELKAAAIEAARQLELASMAAAAHNGADHRVAVRKPYALKK